MKKFFLAAVLAGSLFLAYAFFGGRFLGREYNQSMQIQSLAFGNGAPIPVIYSCEGENKNPPLAITGVPGDARSLALIMDDPDAPRGTFLHWMAWNISPATALLKEGAGVPTPALEGKNDGGKNGYTGPCPPPGKVHHYHFKLYALNAKLDLSSNASKTDLESAIAAHQIAFAELIGTYSR